MLHEIHLKKVLVTICFAAASLLFLFTVSVAFNNVLEPHQQTRIKVT